LNILRGIEKLSTQHTFEHVQLVQVIPWVLSEEPLKIAAAGFYRLLVVLDGLFGSDYIIV